MSIIGDKMRELRGSSSQREMADAIGIKYNAWARYEAGGALPGAEIIEKICRVHACSADWLLGLKDKSPTVSAGPGAAVAVGANARATANTIATSGESSVCKKCPHLKKLKKLEALLKK
jgi:transcriptional regulator with XRE-family HTH domain